MLTGYEDEDEQRTLFLIDASTGEISTPILNALGPPRGLGPSGTSEESLWFATTSQAGLGRGLRGAGERGRRRGRRRQLGSDGGQLRPGRDLQRAGGGGRHGRGAGAGLPVAVSGSDEVHELVPLLFPGPIVVNVGSGTPLAGTSLVQVRFRRTDSRGNVTVSSPGLPKEVTFTDGADLEIAVPPLTHFVGDGTGLQIELYVSVPGTTLLFLASVKDNDATTDYVLFTEDDFDPNDSTGLAAARLVQGGGLTAAAPVPFSAVGVWRDRLFVLEGQYLVLRGTGRGLGAAVQQHPARALARRARPHPGPRPRRRELLRDVQGGRDCGDLRAGPGRRGARELRAVHPRRQARPDVDAQPGAGALGAVLPGHRRADPLHQRRRRGRRLPGHGELPNRGGHGLGSRRAAGAHLVRDERADHGARLPARDPRAAAWALVLVGHHRARNPGGHRCGRRGGAVHPREHGRAADPRRRLRRLQRRRHDPRADGGRDRRPGRGRQAAGLRARRRWRSAGSSAGPTPSSSP